MTSSEHKKLIFDRFFRSIPKNAGNHLNFTKEYRPAGGPELAGVWGRRPREKILDSGRSPPTLTHDEYEENIARNPNILNALKVKGAFKS